MILRDPHIHEIALATRVHDKIDAGRPQPYIRAGLSPSVPGQPSVNAGFCKPELGREVFAAVNGSGYPAHKGRKS